MEATPTSVDADTADGLDPRRGELWQLWDFARGRGLEVGPLHDPLIRRDQADVRYLDVRDQSGLREYYKDHSAIPLDDIPFIDYPLIQDDGRTLSLVEASQEGAPFAWAVASHVIEHVPDLIGWLADLAEVVDDDGALLLIVPDRRYSFDVHRPPTTVGQLLEASALGSLRPGVRAVYDHYRSVVAADITQLWRGEAPGYESRIHSLAEATRLAGDSVDGAYVDCHVWLFTPESFVEQMHELRISGRSQWFVDRVQQTRPNELEFKVRLRRLPREAPATEPVSNEITPTHDRPDWLEEQLAGRFQVPTLTRRVARLERRVLRLQARLDAKSRRLKVMRRKLSAAQTEMATTESRSRFRRRAVHVASLFQRLASGTRMTRNNDHREG